MSPETVEKRECSFTWNELPRATLGACPGVQPDQRNVEPRGDNKNRKKREDRKRERRQMGEGH